jgi:outer membrane protein
MRSGLFAVLALSMLGAVVSSNTARADDESWEVRLRGVYLDPAQQSNAIPGLLPQNAITINDKWLPDLDFEYFFASQPHLSTELVLTYPQTQTVYVEGTPIGTFKHLPPVLTLKYDFLPGQKIQPYVGLGINVTLISDVSLAVPGVATLKLNSTSVGPAYQAGVDVRFKGHFYLNADVKWVVLSSGVYEAGGPKISEVRLNPLLVGVGVGYRF